ncbi:MAG: trigger factor [Peptococcaceae bacterium]|jgi:trigger factor|nr:trigger factor [Peptococcaceae bacterium]MBQ2034640.1 trigger factor [Peptococcaceae bacterium]MBQ2449286.1 trigger factor [Peptococcaceae bacterium]MBQ5682408.1 trigger factor [Peptococcaceae bacterium]MBQ5702192.1 trigger factor [Peptococcaceae bacterium]
MTVSIERLDKVKVELTITVPVEKFEEALKRAYKDMAPKIKVPGFRNGKVPMAVVEKMYGPEVFFEDAANYMIMPNYIDALKEAMAADEKFQAIARPEFDIVQMEKGKEFIFKAVVDTKQEVTLGEYKGLTIEDIDPEVSAKEVDQYVDMIRSKQAEVKTITDKRNVLKKGDTANMDFVGKKDGVPFAGGSAEGYDLEIGSGSFIPGFEEQMEGMKVEEVRNIELSFPEDYYVSDLAGQPVVFEVTLHAIKRKILPELNDEFVKDVSNFETVAEYKEDIKNMLSAEKTAEIKNRHKAAVAQQVVEASDVVAPESMVNEETESSMNDIRFTMKQQGIELEDYLKMTNGKLEDIENECRMRAEALVKQTIVFEAIAEKEGLAVSDEDLEAEYAKMSEMYNQPVETIREVFAMRGQVGAIKRNLLLEKVADFLLENAKIG